MFLATHKQTVSRLTFHNCYVFDKRKHIPVLPVTLCGQTQTRMLWYLVTHPHFHKQWTSKECFHVKIAKDILVKSSGEMKH